MKTSCSSWSYHRTFADKKMTQMSWIDECARLELDGVELLSNHFPSRDAAYLRDLKKRCADRYLTIAMVSAGGHLTTSDDAQRAADVEEIGQWMDVALCLGAPQVRFFCGSGAELSAGGSALYAKVLAAMKQVADMAEKKGVVAALENHGNTSTDQLLAFQRDVGSPWFKFTLDTGNFPPTSSCPSNATSAARGSSSRSTPATSLRPAQSARRRTRASSVAPRMPQSSTPSSSTSGPTAATPTSTWSESTVSSARPASTGSSPSSTRATTRTRSRRCAGSPLT